MAINETIRLGGNEGLVIDISRIVWEDGSNDRPGWTVAHIPADELESAFGSLTFTEDDLEEYLKVWIARNFKSAVKSFRWLWDKYRDTKAA